MRSSLIVLAIVLASLRVVQAAFTRRMRGATLGPLARRRRPIVLEVSELSLAEGVAFRRGTAEAGRKRADGGDAAPEGRASGRFAEWRYYGFSSRGPAADVSAAEPPEVVANSPGIGSVGTILPHDCVTTVVNGCVYHQCGRVWYQRQDSGSNVTYVVVPAP
jgi:hypothetical protein